MAKKTNLTNSAYQSQFLPLIQKAETEIKKLVLFYALHNKSRDELRLKIKGIIKGVDKRLPISLYDRKSYLNGLFQTSEKMIREIYDKILTGYAITLAIVVSFGLSRPKDPLTMVQFINYTKGKAKYKAMWDKLSETKTTQKVGGKYVNMWAEAKGTPYISDYGKLVKAKVKELAQTQTVSEVSTKKPISLWQKAELDLRYEHQVNMVNELEENGVQYAWTSSHPDCSKRCEKWQGKLFDLTAEHSELSNHRMKHKVDGHTVYCFKEVENQVDKYGYKNNIINGFNCRHRLIPYANQTHAPKEYDEKDIATQRKINAKLREYERNIRELKQKVILYKETDKELSYYYEKQAKRLTAEYKAFAEKHGYAWYKYRIDV